MCRNIRTLHHFEPEVTEAEIRAAALQFVRKVSGMNRPSAANAAAFERAVEDAAGVVRTLLARLVKSGAPRDRDAEAAKARARGVARARRLSTPGAPPAS